MLGGAGNQKMLNAPVILLREGTDVAEGRGLVLTNIRACESIVDVVKTTLGPQGMDKLIQTNKNLPSTVTNDGATILELMNVCHPAVSTLVEVAKSQDNEVGDGTTSVVIFAAELLKEAKNLIMDGLHPRMIISGFRYANELALQKIGELKIDLTSMNETEKHEILIKCAETSLNSKLLSSHKNFFANMILEAVSLLDTRLMDKDLIGVKKVSGGSVKDSILVKGVAFKKTFSYAGFEQQPKKILNPKVLLLNVELELKAEKDNAEIRLENPMEYKSIVDAEWQIIYDKLEAIVNSGANVVFSKLAIGDLATQYFADRQIFCAGRVSESDLKRAGQATGGSLLSTTTEIQKTCLGTCGVFEEIQLGAERYTVLSECPKTKTATILLRGGASQFVDEAERSLNDAIMTIRRVLKTQSVVGGGGSIEMELSSHLRTVSLSISGKMQMIVSAYAKALEIIPKCLAINSGLIAMDILNRLRQLHATNDEKSRWMGVDCLGCRNLISTEPETETQKYSFVDAVKAFVWEPSVVKTNAIAAATEAACVILSVDEMVKIPKSNPDPQPQRRQAPPPMGRGVRA